MNELSYEPPSLSVDSNHGIEPHYVVAAFTAVVVVAVVVGGGLFVWSTATVVN